MFVRLMCVCALKETDRSEQRSSLLRIGNLSEGALKKSPLAQNGQFTKDNPKGNQLVRARELAPLSSADKGDSSFITRPFRLKVTTLCEVRLFLGGARRERIGGDISQRHQSPGPCGPSGQSSLSPKITGISPGGPLANL